MNEFITDKGTKIYWEVNYELGGYNQFTSEVNARGYYLSMQRKKREFMMFQDLSKPSGASKILLLEVKRRSKKQLEKANGMAGEKLLEVANYFGL